jgi:hypothetical protein
MMNNPTKFITLLSGVVLLASSGFAQTVATDPVGYVTIDLPSGTNLVTAPLLGDIQHAGLAGTVAGVVVDLPGLTTPVSTPSYVHVTSGTAAGATSSIISSDATSVTLEGAIAGLSEGDSIRIVDHFQLSDLTAASSSSLVDGSVVTIYNSDNTSDSYTTYSNVWYDAGFAASDDVVVFPGEGVVMNLQGETTLTFVGSVNTEPVDVALTSGAVNVIGSVNPSTPSGADSIGDSLAASLADGSTLTLYSEDGALTTGVTYTCYSGIWYDPSFSATNISVASPSAVVVSPQGTVAATMPAAY